MRTIILTAIAAMALTFGAADAMAQKKKAAPQAGGSSYKECCDKANARYYVENGMGVCLMMSEQQHDALYQCTHQRGIKVISKGQIGS